MRGNGYEADAGEGDGRERGGKGRRVGRGTLSWPLTPAIIHEGQLTLAKAYVSVVSQSFP